jgi:transcriptional regulator with XRE-family HTH domain
MSAIDVVFGERLKQFRKEQGRSQASLSEVTGVSQAGISKMESGVQVVYLHQAVALTAALGVTLQDLLTGTRPSEDDLLVEVGRLNAEIGRLRSGLARVGHLAASIGRGSEASS